MTRRIHAGLTLFEVVVCLAVVGLLIGLLIPVLEMARREGRRGAATSNGHQIHLALSLYREQSDGSFPHSGLTNIAPAGLLSDESVLFAQGDPFPQGFGRAVNECRGGSKGLRSPVSWESLDDGKAGSMNRRYSELIDKYDPNPGLLALRVYGDRNVTVRETCDLGRTMLFMGSYLRVRSDGSIQRPTLKFRVRTIPETGYVSTAFYFYSLFTDNQNIYSSP